MSILFMLAAQPAWSQITLLELVDKQFESTLYMDAKAHIQLSEKVVEAIQHEIPIQFITQIELTRRDQIFIFPYNSQQTRIDYTTELSYSHYDRRYKLHNLRNQNILYFSQLEPALATLGEIQNFPITSLNQLHSGLRYKLKLRFRLNYWSLPAPMFTQALLDADWRFKSEWFELDVQTGRRR
ncbi:MAG: DUF4390 domain-containing protein [Thiomicrospira sp.]|uniref:DUF4390 domain-containing protein n=1 Tax=Thiomicrospira sp. TaxID=935 RepID=UPI0019E4B42C|nr:DUF4390 domain-containing protein [Thiomicrospira sp.]MBE0493069.1 DUF4390 domain-containing protein [Thiomicrospira sp.]